jgi:hypothetical protein
MSYTLTSMESIKCLTYEERWGRDCLEEGWAVTSSSWETNGGPPYGARSRKRLQEDCSVYMTCIISPAAWKTLSTRDCQMSRIWLARCWTWFQVGFSTMLKLLCPPKSYCGKKKKMHKSLAMPLQEKAYVGWTWTLSERAARGDKEDARGWN